VTTNGGGGWTAWSGPASDTNVTCPPSVSIPAQLAIWSVGGRMLITSNIGDDVSWSDDLGATWTDYDLTDIGHTQNPQEFRRAGPVGPIYLCYNSADGSIYPESPIFRTPDEGTSWEFVVVPAAWNLSSGSQVAIAYDFYYNWLWFPMRVPGIPSGRTGACYSFEDVYTGDADDWVNRGYNLPAIGAGMNTPAVQGIAIVWD